jgi:cytidylate kinase
VKIKVKAVEQLLNKQVSRWTFLKEKASLRKTKKEKFYPCLTISRETGSGGRLIAQSVAKKLGLKYYDKRIVDLIVKRAKERKELIQSLDEKNLGFIEETFASLFGAKGMSSSTYFRYLVKVILALANQKKCLILGRGANFILPPQRTLRVNVIAPLKTRIANSMQYEGNSLTKAKAMIKKIHFNRKDFIKRYFRKNISNSNYYDLVINTENLTVDQATTIIVNAFKQKFPKSDFQ